MQLNSWPAWVGNLVLQTSLRPSTRAIQSIENYMLNNLKKDYLVRKRARSCNYSRPATGLLMDLMPGFSIFLRYLTEELGYRQSVVDPCLFYLDTIPDEKGHVKVEGVIALATDDLFHGGGLRHLQQMEKLRNRYKLGKYTWKTGRFVGKDIKMEEDGALLISQEFYVESRVQKIPITRERKRRKYSLCTPVEVEQLRTLVGVLAWVAKETRCDLAGKTAICNSRFQSHRSRIFWLETS